MHHIENESEADIFVFCRSYLFEPSNFTFREPLSRVLTTSYNLPTLSMFLTVFSETYSKHKLILRS